MAFARAVGLVGFFILTAVGCGGDDSSSSDGTSGPNGRGGSSASSSETDASSTDDDSVVDGNYTVGNVTYRTEYDFELPAGFQRYTELGARCPAAYAVDPDLAAGKLEYIPCTSGVRGCEQALPSAMGHTLPDEKSWSGGYEYQVAYDDAGHLDKVMSSYFSSSSDSAPYGAVVHDINTGAPLAAWRDAEADVVVRTTAITTDGSAPNPGLITVPSNSPAYSPSSSRCAIYPVLANKTIWVVARASDSTELKVSHGSLSDPAATTKFMALDANDSILGRKMLASDDALAVEQSDGRITVFYASDDSQVTFYGPAMRVWLHSIIGSDVIVYNDQGTDGVIYLRVPRDGESTQLLRNAVTLRVDGTRAAWTVEQSYDLKNTAVVWSAPYATIETATDDGAVHSVPLDLGILKRSCSHLLSDGMYAFLSDCSTAKELTVYVVDTTTGDARSIMLSGGSQGYQEPRTLIAVTETHVWLATLDSLSERHRELQRMAF